MSKIILFRKNRFRVFSIKFYAYLLQRKIINFLSRCTRSLHSPHRRECSPKIFPFFENRKHNFEKPCAYVCGNWSLPRNRRKTWIRSRVWCLSRSMADTKPEYGVQIKRLPVELVRARSEYWKRVALVTCLVSKTPETRLCRRDSLDRSNAHREMFVESSHETGLPLRKLDPKLFWLSFMQSGFNHVLSNILWANHGFPWWLLCDIIFIFQFFEQVNCHFSSHLVD